MMRLPCPAPTRAGLTSMTAKLMVNSIRCPVARSGCLSGSRRPRGATITGRPRDSPAGGLGAIGRKLARLGEGIGMRVIAWTMHPDPSLGFALVDLEELLRTSDVVSLHLRLSEQTRGFFGARELGLMKRSAILINTARGPIVDEAALIEALRSNRLAGAGLDVFDTEPLPAGHAISELPN